MSIKHAQPLALNFRLLLCALTQICAFMFLALVCLALRRNFRLIVFCLAPTRDRRRRLRCQPWAQMKPSKRALPSGFIGPARQRICSNRLFWAMREVLSEFKLCLSLNFIGSPGQHAIIVKRAQN